MHKFILTASLLTATTFVPASTVAANNTTLYPSAKVAIQVESGTDVEAIFNTGLATAAKKTRAANGDWFTVTSDVRVTETITRNVNNSAESRYIQGDEELIEIDISVAPQTVETLSLEFDIGTGSMPETPNTYDARLTLSSVG
jgi:hypothetical protein